MTLLTAAALLVFIVLGRWQWERGVLKDALALQFAQGGDLVTDLGPQGTRDLPRYTQVRVRGEWVADRQFLLDNRTRDGRAGYEVLTPLQLEDGREVLVNRGCASGAEVVTLARSIQESVYGRFGIRLEPEPQIV